MSYSDIFGLLGFFATCFVAASTGAVFQPGAWYDDLRKPSWQPPKWLFPIAWSVLYAMIACAGWLVWRAAGFSGAVVPLLIYAVQLVLNATWSALFFGLHRMDLAFAEVLLLWLSILGTILAFHSVAPLAAWLLVPYLAWVSFAAFLNLTVWQLNRA